MRADRLISILLLLQIHGRLAARELAERLEVSERTVLRDMDALAAAGVPVVAERGPGGGWRLIDGYQTRLTGLTPTEVQTLFFAQPPQLLAGLGLEQAAEAARLKLQAALPEAIQQQAERARRSILIDPRGWREAQSLTSLPALLDALWRSRSVRFRYESGLGEVGERIVDPLGLVARGSTWYLVASKEGQLRTYRVSRISEVRLDGRDARRPDGFDLAAYWETSTTELRERLPRYSVTALAAPSVMRWARYRGWRLEDEREEGDRVRIRLRFDAEEEGLQFALSFGGDVEVIEPVELRDKVLHAARNTIGRYTPDVSESSAPPDSITTPRVVLRRAGPADTQCLFQVARDPEVMRFMDWPMPTDPGSVEAHLENVVAEWKKGTEYQWVILERSTGECAGTISCRPANHAADFGYFLGRAHWGKGLATEAAAAVVAWLSSQPHIFRIWATVDVENARSRRLLERLGLTLEGVLRKATIRPNIGGPPRDTAVYARTVDPPPSA